MVSVQNLSIVAYCLGEKGTMFLCLLKPFVIWPLLSSANSPRVIPSAFYALAISFLCSFHFPKYIMLIAARGLQTLCFLCLKYLFSWQSSLAWLMPSIGLNLYWVLNTYWRHKVGLPTCPGTLPPLCLIFLCSLDLILFHCIHLYNLSSIYPSHYRLKVYLA